MIAGFTGLVSLIKENWHTYRNIAVVTYTFAGIALFFGLAIFASRQPRDLLWGYYTAVLIILAPLYADWALGAMADNLLGVPSGDSAPLYWSYFVLKRFTMISV